MNKPNQFGERVRALRTHNGLSQEEFAELCGLHRTYISGIERGVRNPTLSIILQIAAALKVPPASLFEARGFKSER